MEEELEPKNDVPETSEEELEEVNIDTSEDNETEQTQERDIEAEIEERASKRFEEKVEERLIQDRRARESKSKEELRKYKYLEEIVKAGTGTNSLDEAIQETANFYKGNGLDIPEFINYSEEDERVLGRNDANQIMDLSYKEMEEEAQRLANIPRDVRTIREQEKLYTLGVELKRRGNIENMKAKGYDTSILETQEFKEFSNQFNSDTDISKVYEMYKKLAENNTKPASVGSAKSEAQPKETFSPQRINEMTPNEMLKYWNNPEFRKIAGLN